MLAEALDAFIEQVGKNTRDRVRVIEVQGGAPGVINIMTQDKDGTFSHEAIDYDLAPYQFKAQSLNAFMETLKTELTPEPTVDSYQGAKVYIGENQITAFLLDVDNEPLHADRLTLKLEHTDQFNFVTQQQRMKASQMKHAIQELFTGSSGAVLAPLNDTSILSLIPMLSKVSVKEQKGSVSIDTKNAASVGLDVQQQLDLGGEEIPEMVTAPVKVYDQFNYVHFVRMLFRYDWENKVFILSPVRNDIEEAVDTTVEKITEIIDSVEGIRNKMTVVPADIIMPQGSAKLDD